MFATQPIRPVRALSLAGLGVIAAIAVGCSDKEGVSPLVLAPPNAPKPPDSVFREVSPQMRSAQLQSKLAQRRQETFGSGLFGVAHHDINYTAAYRHAVYLNTVNSNGADVAASIPSVPPVDIITPDSSYVALYNEPVVPGAGYRWPALFTNDALPSRVEAVSGGRDLMRSLGAGAVDEVYVFNGDVFRTNGTTVQFRGYPQTVGDSVDQVWYSRRGRAVAMRAALRTFGFGHKNDVSAQNGAYSPPYPLFGGQFLGVVTMISASPAAAALGSWPNDNNQDVNPYGLDTDVGGPGQYAGTPLHITLPVDEPIVRNTGVVELSLTKVDGYGSSTGVAPLVPTNGDLVRVYSNVSGLTITTTNTGTGVYGVDGPIAPSVTGVRVTGWSQTGRISPAGINGPTADEDGFVVATLSSGVSNFAVGDFVEMRITDGDPNPNVPVNQKPDVGSYGRFQVTGVNAATGAIEINCGAVETQSPGFLFIDDLIWQLRKDPVTSSATKQFVDFDNLEIDLYKTGATAKSGEVDDKLKLRNGEILIVPLAPLEASTWYRFQYHFKTTSYDSGLKTSYFRTNAKAL